MADNGGDLAEIQTELRSVKQALRGGHVYLGMNGETLQRYLLQLNEKENLLLSRQLRVGDGQQTFEPLLPPVPGSSAPAKISSAGYASVAAPEASAQAALVVQPRPAPDGPAKGFDRENLASVLAHMTEYEASPQESFKALRALATLAYASAQQVGENDEVLAQTLRLVDIHGTTSGVELAAMRALCNMAYAPAVALGGLAHPRTLGAFLVAAGKSGDVNLKAREAVARVVAAETCPGESTVLPASPLKAEGLGPTANLFVAAMGGDSTWQASASQLVVQLITNEVIEAKGVAQRFVAASQSVASPENSEAATGWLQLAKLLSALSPTESMDLPQALVDANAIGAAVDVMEMHVPQAATQLAGIEAMSSLVGNRWAGLQAFAAAKGMQRIEAAMHQHGGDVVLQTKGIRALASGVQWPADVQEKATYSSSRSVQLTKVAMSQHGGNVELQTAALEGLAKYIDKTGCVDLVKDEGGEELVKGQMTAHINQPKVQSWGRIVLDAMGVDRSWQPSSAANV